jgi:hypothetical protein
VTSTRDAVQGCVIEPLGVMRCRAVATRVFVTAIWMPHGSAPMELADAPVVTFVQRRPAGGIPAGVLRFRDGPLSLCADLR